MWNSSPGQFSFFQNPDRLELGGSDLERLSAEDPSVLAQMAQRDAGGRYVHLGSSWQIARNLRNIILHFSWLTMVIESCNPQWLTIVNPQRRSWVFCIYDTLLFTTHWHPLTFVYIYIYIIWALLNSNNPPCLLVDHGYSTSQPTNELGTEKKETGKSPFSFPKCRGFQFPSWENCLLANTSTWSILDWDFPINHPAIGDPPFQETPESSYRL